MRYPIYHHVHRWGFAIFGGLFWLLVLAGLAVVVAWLVSRAWAPRHPVSAPHAPYGPPVVDPAFEQLRVRYARGEIDADQYRRVAADLGHPVAPPPPPGPPPAAAPAGPAAESAPSSPPSEG